MSLPTEGLQRRHYIELIRRAYTKWVNPDPTVEIKIGAYGRLDKETGVFIEEGNVYDSEFKKVLDKHEHGVNITMSDHPPEEGPTESDVVVSTREVKEGDLNVNESVVPGIANAPIKGQWVFNEGKTDAVFAMHRPHQIYLPPRVVLEHLYRVDKLVDKWLVTIVHVTDAYAFYLSDKSGDKLSLALVPNGPTSGAAGNTAGANGGFTWWADAPSGLLRHASDPTGKCSFMPIYILMRPIKRIRRVFIDKIRPEPSGDELWYNDAAPWDPIDEDGFEDELDPEVTAVDPFALVEQQHLETCDGCFSCSLLRRRRENQSK